MFGLTYLSMIIFVASFLNSATAKVLYITPSTSDLCTTQCLTISELAANTSNYISSNTTLVFTAGTHHLTSDLTVSDVNNVSITSNGSHAAIVYMYHSYINVIHSQFIHISNTDFFCYGGINVSNVEEFMLQNAVFDGQDKTETSLSLFESTASIINCGFISNNIKDILPKYPIVMTDVYERLVQYTLHSLVVVIDSNTSFSQCKFEVSRTVMNTTYLLVINSWVTIDSSTFVNNTAAANHMYGHVIYQHKGHVDISNCYFYNNSADGVIRSLYGSLNVTNSNFSENIDTGRLRLIFGSGVFSLYHSNGFACNNSFDNNNGDVGGVLNSYESSITLETCSFDSNHAKWGGVLFDYDSTITIKECNFTHNTAWRGAVIYATNTSLTMNGSVVIANNVATEYATVYLDDSEVYIRGDYVIFSNNTGSFVAYNAYVSFMGYTNFLNNQINAQDDNILEGGAITLFLSVMHFDGPCNVSHNHAVNGGAIRSSESKVYVSLNGRLTVTHNSANESGGGIYLYNSEMNCSDCSLQLSHNTAKSRGGGIHAIASTIKLYHVLSTIDTVVFTNNSAEKGGGLSMESNSKLYMLGDFFSPMQVYYERNSADYGAAMFVDDDTYTSMCSRKLKGECFFQVMDRYYTPGKYLIYLSQNTARYSGSTLYGGLLDCKSFRTSVPLFRSGSNKWTSSFQVSNCFHKSLHIIWSS